MDLDVRTEARYFVVTPVAAEINGLNADVIDLSTRGARLQLTQRIAIGNIVPFTLRNGDGTIATSASVVWCEVAALALDDEETDRYFCGVAFVEAIPQIAEIIRKLLESKAALPIEESRTIDRYRVVAPLTASFADQASLRVLDISIRGVRVLSPSLLQPGSSGRLRFTISDNDTNVWLPATVVWARAAARKGRYEAGLRISDAEEWLRTVIDELALRDGVAIDADSLRRKFDPFAIHPVPGVVALR